MISVSFVFRSHRSAHYADVPGIFLATGNSDSVVRVYCMSQSVPEKICELEAHTDRVDSIQYSHRGDRFISGSKDGTARIWYFRASQWQVGAERRKMEMFAAASKLN